MMTRLDSIELCRGLKLLFDKGSDCVVPNESPEILADGEVDPSRHPSTLFVEETGLAIPPALLSQYGFSLGEGVRLRETAQGLLLQRIESGVKNLYIEPTNACNLNCRTCIRNTWEASVGFFDINLFRKLIRELEGVKSLEKISFWGFGEPLLHPDIAEMVALASGIGVKTQMITNALLLDEVKARELVRAGLDSLVVSIDGTTEATVAAVRPGASLQLIKENIAGLRRIRKEKPERTPEIGVEFVAMKSNIKELENLRPVALDLGASFIIVTNLLPYDEKMKGDILYWNSVGPPGHHGRSKWVPEIFLSKMDPSVETNTAIAKLQGNVSNIHRAGDGAAGEERCRFVRENSCVVSWDGVVSPCIAMMHSYTCYVLGRAKKILRYDLGNIKEELLLDIWNKDEYVKFRAKVRDFDFSPCLDCSGCLHTESNEQDCFDNNFPVCGDCLWAYDIIQCP
jgi:radical SAM protein with 4Fe4S-binding SPASM domain